MAEHLPECFANQPFSIYRPSLCICDRLRACEQRARDELPPNGADATWYLLGQRKGLQAARDAVAAIPHDTYCATRDENYRRPCNCPLDDALAAIDALLLPAEP